MSPLLLYRRHEGVQKQPERPPVSGDIPHQNWEGSRWEAEGQGQEAVLQSTSELGWGLEGGKTDTGRPQGNGLDPLGLAGGLG